MRAALLLLLAAPAMALGQASEIQRALVQRDQMTAEFAAQLTGAPSAQALQALHARQLGETQLPANGDPARAQAFLPYQRARMEDERRVLRLAPPVARKSVSDTDLRPLALPGGARRGVDPVAPERLDR